MSNPSDPHVTRLSSRKVLACSVAALALTGAGALTMSQASADDGAAAPSDARVAGTAPVSTRSLTAALQSAVADVADGTTSGFSGFLTYADAWQTHDPLVDDASRDSFAGSFTFAPADGSGAALVSADLTDKAGWDYNRKTAEENLSECDDFKQDCEVTTLPDGSLLRTYTTYGMASNGSAQGHEMVHAERIVGDAVISVTATNGGDLTATGNEVTRAHAALSVEQLTEIVSAPWWGYDLPQEFADAGAQLPSFDEEDSVID